VLTVECTLSDMEVEVLCLALLGLGGTKNPTALAEHVVTLSDKFGITDRMTAKASQWLKFAVKEKREQAAKGGAA
jgi:hypothetical protein